MAPRISRVRLGLRRSIVANQMLLSAAALIGILVSIAVGHVVDPTLFLAGASLLFAGAIAAVLLPWDRVSQLWAACCDRRRRGRRPDARERAARGSRTALGLPGALDRHGVRGVGHRRDLGLGDDRDGPPSRRHRPAALHRLHAAAAFVVAALSTIAHFTARRSQAQRELLEKQSAELRRAVERARRQEDLVTEVLDAVDFGVTRVTAAGEFAVTNAAHARLLNTTDVLGREVEVFAADGSTLIAADATPLARARAGEVSRARWSGTAGRGGPTRAERDRAPPAGG